MDESVLDSWRPVTFNISQEPNLLSSTHLPGDSEFLGNFARSAKWCPDGTSILSQTENRTFLLWDDPEHMFASIAPVHHSSLFHRSIHQPAPVLDYVWYPRASAKDPASFCFLSSTSECPVKLLDAKDGRLRASYPIIDHRERFIAPHSMAFNPTLDKVYCGFEDAIEVFDIHRPGEGTRLHTRATKSSKDGLAGIISAISFSPYDMFAIGSLSAPGRRGNIAIMSEAQNRQPVMYVGTDSNDITTGTTQLMFNPMKPHLLYATFRRLTAVYCWDLRNDVSSPMSVYTSTEEKQRISRDRTNQRLRFDVDLAGNVMAMGDYDGNIRLYDLKSAEITQEELDAVYANETVQPETHATLDWHAHDDAVGSVAFHPTNPLLLSVSGSRHFLGYDSGSSSEEESDDSSSGEDEETPVRRSRERPRPLPRDSSTKIWYMGV